MAQEKWNQFKHNGRCPTPDKKRFASKKDAKEYIKVNRRSYADATGLHAYSCMCGCYHLTSMPKWKATILNGIMYRPLIKYAPAFKKFMK